MGRVEEDNSVVVVSEQKLKWSENVIHVGFEKDQTRDWTENHSSSQKSVLCVLGE